MSLKQGKGGGGIFIRSARSATIAPPTPDVGIINSMWTWQSKEKLVASKIYIAKLRPRYRLLSEHLLSFILHTNWSAW